MLDRMGLGAEARGGEEDAEGEVDEGHWPASVPYAHADADVAAALNMSMWNRSVDSLMRPPRVPTIIPTTVPEYTPSFSWDPPPPLPSSWNPLSYYDPNPIHPSTVPYDTLDRITTLESRLASLTGVVMSQLAAKNDIARQIREVRAERAAFYADLGFDPMLLGMRPGVGVGEQDGWNGGAEAFDGPGGSMGLSPDEEDTLLPGLVEMDLPPPPPTACRSYTQPMKDYEPPSGGPGAPSAPFSSVAPRYGYVASGPVDLSFSPLQDPQPDSDVANLPLRGDAIRQRETATRPPATSTSASHPEPAPCQTKAAKCPSQLNPPAQRRKTQPVVPPGAPSPPPPKAPAKRQRETSKPFGTRKRTRSNNKTSKSNSSAPGEQNYSTKGKTKAEVEAEMAALDLIPEHELAPAARSRRRARWRGWALVPMKPTSPPAQGTVDLDGVRRSTRERKTVVKEIFPPSKLSSPSSSTAASWRSKSGAVCVSKSAAATSRRVPSSPSRPSSPPAPSRRSTSGRGAKRSPPISVSSRISSARAASPQTTPTSQARSRVREAASQPLGKSARLSPRLSVSEADAESESQSQTLSQPQSQSQSQSQRQHSQSIAATSSSSPATGATDTPHCTTSGKYPRLSSVDFSALRPFQASGKYPRLSAGGDVEII
jgi:hypothetical protein